ncbi:serum paraoxonase/arylesterase [Rhizoctonia solani AG-3 Rhs1AP]|uniref:Serum paraoxonase/arylesterase n=2 Tax=Rhizoctonia solani AG-3 TaxID=1086053 RepID=A0A074RZG3_9AGAM|nr:serum paraoxonase/arylesterase [Rhizoctonia solani AG-3 Rhs1AP]KEP52461.1 serum paraoxonase/arylesterase [Rhizoctonia solani 123E]
MPSIVGVFFTLTVLTLGIVYQVYVSPFLTLGGWYRSVEPLNIEHCTGTEELKACEKLVIHPSGVVYLACAPSPESRLAWMPAVQHFNSTHMEGTPSEDYVATYDTQSHKITKLSVTGFADPRRLNVHGMDVVPDEHNPDLLWVYLVNHRPPLSGLSKNGADSAIEVFKTYLGSSHMEWVRTFAHPEVVLTPNDVVGGSNGKEVWFTNDYPVKQGMKRELHAYFQIGSTWIGYCHADTGCKIAADDLYTSNGIVRTRDGNIWVGSVMGGYLTVHEQQADKTLVQTDIIQLGSFVDNLSVAPDGSVIATTFPKAELVLKSFKDTKVKSPSSAHRISINKGESSYYGEKYKVQKIYEDDGALGSSATSTAVYDGNIYLHGLMSHRLQICKIPSGMLQ